MAEQRLPFHEAIELHEVLNDLSKQAELDIKSVQMAQQIAGLDLFPGNTSRLGTFATP